MQPQYVGHSLHRWTGAPQVGRWRGIKITQACTFWNNTDYADIHMYEYHEPLIEFKKHTQKNVAKLNRHDANS